MTTESPQEPVAIPIRRLFLDDDRSRAEVFLASYPDAVWVETVPECLAKLEESWDEVHLDHDLGGEVYVDILRADCGMEVVRWLVTEPRPHLKPTKFTIHSWNDSAAIAMLWHLEALGYQVEARPFGQPRDQGGGSPESDTEHEAEFVYTYEPDPTNPGQRGWWKRWMSRWFGRSSEDSYRDELPDRSMRS